MTHKKSALTAEVHLPPEPFLFSFCPREHALLFSKGKIETKNSGPQATQHKYHIIKAVYLSILSFHNFLHYFLYNFPS